MLHTKTAWDSRPAVYWGACAYLQHDILYAGCFQLVCLFASVFFAFRMIVHASYKSHACPEPVLGPQKGAVSS